MGDQFGIEKYSTVSSIVERVKHEMNVDKGLKNRVQKLSEKISKSQRQTWPCFKPNIKWTKDRGKDVQSAPWYHLGPEYGGKEGDRINDHHLTLEEKRKAREQI